MDPKTLLVGMIALGTSLAGCISTPGSAVDDAQALDDAVAAVTPVTNVLQGSIMISAGTPVRTVNYGGAFVNEFPVEETFNGIVFELEWTPSSAASQELSLWVREAGVASVPPEDPAALLFAAGPLAKAEGASPLRLTLAPDAFPESGMYEVVVRAVENGVAVEQPYTLHVTTFEGTEYDETFSALDATETGDGEG